MSSRRKGPGNKRPNTPAIPETSQEIEEKKLLKQIADLPPETRQKIFGKLAIHKSSSFSGPIPPPEDLDQYKKIVPDAGERIVAMAEEQQSIQRTAIEGEIENDRQYIKNDTIRIYCVTILGLALIIVAGIATWQGSALIAIPLGIAGVLMSLLKLIRDWLNLKQDVNSQ